MNARSRLPTVLVKTAAVVAILFGLATIWQGGRVLLGGEDAVSAAGDYVSFVVWFNTAAGFAYVAAGAGLWFPFRGAVVLAWVIAGTTLAVFAALGVHIALGGAYEARTVAAMALRSGFWLATAFIASRAGRGSMAFR